MTPPQRRAVGIVRVSQVNGRNGESFHSPDTQRERIENACATNHWKLLTVHEELDVSGGKPLAQRPGLLAAVKAVEAGRAEIVLAAYLDRLTRDPGVRDQVIDRIEAVGGEVFAVDMGRQTNGTAVEQLTGTLASAVHRYVRRVGAERSREAQVAAIARGVAPWPNILPGYERGPNGVLRPDPATQAVVAEAFELRAAGRTVQAVRDHLAANGIVRSYHGTSALLASRMVLGELHFGDYEPNLEAWPAIVDRDLWNRVQRMKVSRGRRAKSDRLLARLGVLRCGTCGARMVVGSAVSGRYFVYRCPPNGGCSRHVTISAEVVEAVVVAGVRANLDGCVGIQAAQDNVRQARVALQCAQGDLDTALRMLDDFTNEPAAKERLVELRRVRDLAQERVDQVGDVGSREFLCLGEDWDQLSGDDQRQCIRATLAAVLVHPAVRGQRPEDRVEFVPHDRGEWWAGLTPPAPDLLEAKPFKAPSFAVRTDLVRDQLWTKYVRSDGTPFGPWSWPFGPWSWAQCVRT
ncbi:MAG: recombinase family protein [Solirubrobacteraceae bacterium]